MPEKLLCEAIEGEGEPCGADAERVLIRGKIASVYANLCIFHQGQMSDEEGYLVLREVEGGRAST